MLEPLYEYVVTITYGEGIVKSKLDVLTLAHTTYHAREKVYGKMCHIHKDINNYSFGTKALVHKPDPVSAN